MQSGFCFEGRRESGNKEKDTGTHRESARRAVYGGRRGTFFFGAYGLQTPDRDHVDTASPTQTPFLME